MMLLGKPTPKARTKLNLDLDDPDVKTDEGAEINQRLSSGSSVEGNEDQASQLGKMLGVAVQAELVKQKRPGGLLAS